MMTRPPSLKDEEEAIQFWCSGVRTVICRDCQAPVRLGELSASQQLKSNKNKSRQ